MPRRRPPEEPPSLLEVLAIIGVFVAIMGAGPRRPDSNVGMEVNWLALLGVAATVLGALAVLFLALFAFP